MPEMSDRAHARRNRPWRRKIRRYARLLTRRGRTVRRGLRELERSVRAVQSPGPACTGCALTESSCREQGGRCCDLCQHTTPKEAGL
jgi:hypothetical protein